MISRSRRWGARPLAVNASATVSAIRSMPNWAEDKFTETVMVSGQAVAVLHASCNTQAPSRPMTPMRSAAGMNSEGGMNPPLSSVRRASASNPTSLSPGSE